MVELHTQIEINAPAERVWDTLTNFSAYPDWNPFIAQVVGQPVAGTHLSLGLRHNGEEPTWLSPTIVTVTPERELRWVHRLGLPGVLTRDHTLKIERLGPDSVRFVQWEVVSGLLAPLFALRKGQDTRQGLEEMNKALKARAERPRTSAAPLATYPTRDGRPVRVRAQRSTPMPIPS